MKNPLRGIIGIFVNIFNYWYAVNCFKLLKQYPEIWNKMKMGISPVGILYFRIELDKDLLDKHDQIIASIVQPIDDSLLGMDLYGIVNGTNTKLGVNSENRVVYLIKYEPSTEHWTIKNFLFLFLFMFLLYKAFIKFELFNYITLVIDYIK